MNKSLLYLLCLIFYCFFSCEENPKNSNKLPEVEFALNHINAAKQKTATNFESIDFFLDTINLNTEAYKISVDKSNIKIYGGDVNGLMYGGLEVAEQIELYNSVKSTEDTPYINKRGIKFNIPLDARTPGYDDTGDAAQQNYASMWEWDFWEEFLDDMAIHRYNTLTLWNPHPFPSMIKMDNFPDVALDDVCVTTLTPTGKESEWGEPQMVSTNVVENLKVTKKMTIDEKIVFWKKVMDHAKNRGIDLYFFTWNICANGAGSPVPPHYRTYHQPLWKEIPGKHGITNQMDNPINVKYYREAVKTFLLTYPNVKGIGVTAGEHMLDEAGGYTREQWIWETYGLGMLDAKKEQPNRKVDFIHRVWNTDMDKIMHYWKDYSGSFEASYKYAKARLYSSPYLNFADEHIEAMKKYDLKSWWNLRNDDIFVHRWGDPDYVRAFIGHFQKEHTAGYYMGSDGYVWGKEFASKVPELSGELEIKKHWYNFMLWGRLGYNNKLSKTFFVKKLQSHFPETNSDLLYTTWQSASKIVPMVNRFHWQNWDFQWSIEGCIDQRNGFHDINMFIDNPTMKGSNILNPNQYAKAIINNVETKKITPLQIADSLNTLALQTLKNVEGLENSKNNSKSFLALLDDMRSMSYMGQYYASKIQAATCLALFKESKKASYKNKAIKHLEIAANHWKLYQTISEKNYKPQRLARTRMLDWTEILEYVKHDVEIAKKINLKN